MSPLIGFEMMASAPFLFWALAIAAVTAVAISKSGFGGAMGSLSVPILLFVLPPKAALGVMLPLFLVIDIWVVYVWRRMLNRRILLIMCLFGLSGQMVGWLLFDYLSDVLLTGLIGGIAVITALNYLRRRIWPGTHTTAEIATIVARRIWQRGFLWCGLSGVSSFVSLSGGIPAQVFLLPHLAGNAQGKSICWCGCGAISRDEARICGFAAIFSCLRKKKFSGAIFCEKLRSLYPVQGQRSMDLTTSGDHMV